MTDIEKLWRWRATATTWTAKATDLLLAFAAEGEHHHRNASYEAQRLMEDTLWRFETLVPLLNTDDDYDLEVLADLERSVKDIAYALRARRLSVALSNTEGRTDAEAETFAAKASEFSGRA